MKNNYFNYSVANIYSKPSSNSEVISQILYGEKFKILLKKKNWFKIKTDYDNYIGYIKKRKFIHDFKPRNKICAIKSIIYKKEKNRFSKTNNFLFFGSKLEFKKKERDFVKFSENKWIKIKDTKKINHIEKNFSKIFKLFLNTKYLWGGKTINGIDCSALIQIYFYYNQVFFPRDSKDQSKFCKKKISKKLLKGDIIFWKGHVGVCVGPNKFIHAYGPRKKVLLMPTKFTINLIKKTANLSITKISNIKKH